MEKKKNMTTLEHKFVPIDENIDVMGPNRLVPLGVSKPRA